LYEREDGQEHDEPHPTANWEWAVKVMWLQFEGSKYTDLCERVYTHAPRKGKVKTEILPCKSLDERLHMKRKSSKQARFLFTFDNVLT
jgi:hypothetical protein